MTDISERVVAETRIHALNAQLQDLATRDVLTGLCVVSAGSSPSTFGPPTWPAGTGARSSSSSFPALPSGPAMQRAESLRTRIRDATVSAGSPNLKVTASLGVATYPQDGETGELLLRAADEALFGAKRAGRDRVVQA